MTEEIQIHVAPEPVKCVRCSKLGCFSTTPFGADYNTCPVCNYMTDADFESDLCWCSNCYIVYDLGCKHANNGCTDDVYNAHLITLYKDIRSGVQYSGVPIFKTKEELYNLKYVQVLEFICPNEGKICEKTSNPVNDKCWLTTRKSIN